MLRLRWPWPALYGGSPRISIVSPAARNGFISRADSAKTGCSWAASTARLSPSDGLSCWKALQPSWSDQNRVEWRLALIKDSELGTLPHAEAWGTGDGSLTRPHLLLHIFCAPCST